MPNNGIYDEAQIKLAIELLVANRSTQYIRKKTGITELELYRILDERGINASDYQTLTAKDRREIAGVLATRKARRYWDLYRVGDEVIAKQIVKDENQRKRVLTISGTITIKTKSYLQILQRNGWKESFVFGEVASKTVILRKKIEHIGKSE